MNPEATMHITGRRYPLRVLTCLAMLFAAGCGGDAGNYQAGGGIGGTGVAIGSVSGHGSIIVNGVRFDTAGAEIFSEGDPVGTGDQAAHDLLPIGQEVVVRGDIADDLSGSATRVDAFNRVRGPLDAFEPFDAHNARMVIMGQTVYVNPETHWEEISMEETALQTVLEVSGPVDDTGVVHAGRVRWVAPYLLGDTRVMVKGPVQDLNPLQRTFRINGLEIDYSHLQEPMAWMDSRTVSVQGRLAADILIADAIDSFVTASFDSATDFILEGFVQASDGPYPWRVGEYDLRFDAPPEIDITDGIRIQARGTLQDRVLWVDAVRAATAVRLESNAASVDAENGVLTLDGMAPLAVRVNPLTRIIAVGPPGTLADIQVGDHLSIYAQAIDDRSAAATMILVIPGSGVSGKFHLEGPVTSIDAFQFAVLSVAVDTEANADIRFYDTDEEALDVGEFMAALVEGTLVRVTGRWDGDRIGYETMTIVR